MQISYTEKAKQSADYELLRQADARLEEILGSAAEPVSGTWDCIQDADDGPLYMLRLAGRFNEVKRTFEPNELRSSNMRDFWLYLLWGKFLQARNERLLRQLLTTES